MRAILILFDSLRRDFLPPYGCGETIAPNFSRLAAHCQTFDSYYVGSLPCMPARRELHTGRYGFLHRGWMPLEPFDDSAFEMLTRAGVHTHLVSDHYHYWQEGGANYHGRYKTWEMVRGQEGDAWRYEPCETDAYTTMLPVKGTPFEALFKQDAANRPFMNTKEAHPQTRVFDGALRFLSQYEKREDWVLQIESFDPHEPFFSLPEYNALYEPDDQGRVIDWPQPVQDTLDAETRARVRARYRALLTQCDESLGRVLDFMDARDMWKDTLLMVGTDHGLLLSEHGWWGKGPMPPYNEIAHLPFFLHDPRENAAGTRNARLSQNIDVPATLLDCFGLPLPKDMLGRPFREENAHDAILFGYHGGMTCVTDGKWLYMRAPQTKENAPLYDYTLAPAAMHERMGAAALQNAALHPPFSFTKGCPTLQIKRDGAHPFLNPYRFGHLLFDLMQDSGELSPIESCEVESKMCRTMTRLMRENDAPKEQYERMGL